jgi:hypothetical protein
VGVEDAGVRRRNRDRSIVASDFSPPWRPRAPVGRQLVVYLVAVSVNYVAFIAGVADGLAAAGLEFHVARILAGGCEGIYMYCVFRWVVFRNAPL